MEPTAQPQPDNRSVGPHEVYVWIPAHKTDVDPSGRYVRAVDLTEEDRADLVRAALTTNLLGIDEIREVLSHRRVDSVLAYVRRGGPPPNAAS